MQQEEVHGLQAMACYMSGHCLSLDWRTGWAWGPEGRVYRQPCPHHVIRTSRPLKAPWGTAVPFSAISSSMSHSEPGPEKVLGGQLTPLRVVSALWVGVS